MQGGVIGGFCLLAFLLSIGRAEELESKVLPDVDQVKETVSIRKSGDLEAQGDLKSEINLAVSQSNSRANEGRSGDVSQSDARSFEDSGVSAVAQTSGDGYASAYADSIGDSSQSKAFAAAGGAPASPFNPFNEELGPYMPPGSSFSQAEAQAIKIDSHGQGLNSYPNPASYPYNSGLPAQAQADNGLYQRPPNLNPQADGGYFQRDYNPYGQGLSPGQALNQAENGLYQPGYNGPPNVSPYTQASSFPPGQDDSESNQPIIEPNSVLPKPAPRQSVLDSRSTLSSSYHYSPGTSSSSIHTQDNSVPYQPVPIPDPNYSPYEQFLVPYKGPSSAQTQSNNEEYHPVPIIEPKGDRLNLAYDVLTSHLYGQNEPYQGVPIPDPNPSPYAKFLVPYKEPTSRHQSEPSSKLPDADSRLNSERSYYVDNIPSSRTGFTYNSVQLESSADRGPYQSNLIPNPGPYDSNVVPYIDTSYSQKQINNRPYQPIPIPSNFLRMKASQDEIKSYQPIPVPDSNPTINESSMVQHREQNSEIKSYQPIPVPDLNPTSFESSMVHLKEQNSEIKSYQPIPVPDSNPTINESSMVQHREQNSEIKSYQPIPVPDLNPTSFESSMVHLKEQNSEIKSYQSIPVPDSNPTRYESSRVQHREQNSEKNKLQHEGYAYEYQPSPNTKTDAPLSSSPTISIARSHEYNSVIDDTDSSVGVLSKSGWNPYEYNLYTPSGAYPQLYPSGAEAVQSYPDFKPAASVPYSQGISPYASDYTMASESLPFRQGVNNPIEAHGPPNVFASGQSSPIAFEDAKSRVISPNEYVFPSKMPGGENAIQCRKENEFHHFWSQGMDCLVCICLNEYGVLQPVCASCGGCHNPPPKLPEPVPRLPESIPIQLATPGPFEPIPMIPEPLPVPPSESNPVPPLPEPDQTIPTPEPYPGYPEPVQPPSPTPVTFPEPVATLPPPPDQAHCNPLPTGVPFTNPLHPCQICICREALVTGKTDVSIECKENPQCIAPSDVTALPPLPDVPKPVPLPICEKFPENVLFPHPTETCKLCKCAKSLSRDGVYEQQITCYPHPDCAVPKLEALTEPAPPLPIPVDPYQEKPYPEPGPVTIEPLREPDKPMEPVPLPEVVTVEPLPWPPITTVAPVPPLPATPRPGPLPGPSPHESCRPYPPNQTFQHPWDECQVCICTEATAVGMITVEVNCYTKPSCCIEPPDSVKTALPGKLLHFIGFSTPYLGPSNAVNSPDVQAVPSGTQPTTSTYRPPPQYPSYSPRPVNIYPVANTATDPLNQAPAYSGYVDPANSYPYQPNYASQYVNSQYPEYPPRLPVLPGTGNTVGQYKPNNFGYPANYQYASGDAVGNNFPPQGHYQPFDPRFQTVPAQPYPGIYQRAYDRPHIYLPQLRDGYVKPPVPALGGPNLQNLAPTYAAPIGYSKSGKDGPDDDSR